jgi:Terminase large subunit, T4likevirus-type, N-terminal
MSDNQTIIWQPQEGPQTALLQCPVFEVFYGGARGGGKTESSIGDWLDHSSTYGEHAIGIFVRRKLKQLEEVIARTKQLFPKIGAKYNEQAKTWTMANGARLKFVYLERDSDAEEYQGHNYTRVYVEEVTNFPSPGPIDKLRATLRSGAGVPVGMRLTGNPGGAGHNWVKKRYIDPCPAGYQIITESIEIELDGEMKTVSLDRVFIPSKLKDNSLLLRGDPTYVLRLRQSGSEQLVRAWLEGDWNIIDGAFFDEFDPGRHILSHDWLALIPRNAVRFRSFDWGSAKPFSVGWWAISDGTWGLPNQALLRYQEWYGAKGPNVGLKMTADLVAAGILEREKGQHIQYGVADPACFIRNGGPSIAETMIVKGCGWRPADNKRQPGWEKLRQRLVGEEGKPMLYVLETCDDFIRTIPILQHDDTNPEDLDTEAEDHVADEVRYAVMSRPWAPKHVAPQGLVLPKLPGEYTINELIARRRARRISAERMEN